MIKLSDLNNKTAAVVGIGISNRPLIDFLLKHGMQVVARDLKTRDKLEPFASEIEAKGVKLVCGENYLDDIREDYVFRAPGVRYDKPGIAKAVENGAVLTSEMELFFDLTPAKLIAVTGSDGKTTTTTLTYKILEKAGHRVYVGGNIGTPLLPYVEEMTSDDIAVLELSSFQLHTMKKSPHIAVITNVAPNHLDYHKGMEEYIEAKTNIFSHECNERLILNHKNDITRSLAKRARKDSKVVFFQNENGVSERDGAIYYGDEKVLDIADIILPGHHNIENYMAAIAATRGLCTNEDVAYIARTFKGVAHRCELVRERRGVKFYNSSIDSSPTRTSAALTAFGRKVIVICGGYDKHIPYEPLAPLFSKFAKKVVLTGATGPKIKSVIENYDGAKPEIIERPVFDEAVYAAVDAADAGDVVILSPASASFDAFPNFEVRGNHFKELILNLPE